MSTLLQLSAELNLIIIRFLLLEKHSHRPSSSKHNQRRGQNLKLDLFLDLLIVSSVDRTFHRLIISYLFKHLTIRSTDHSGIYVKSIASSKYASVEHEAFQTLESFMVTLRGGDTAGFRCMPAHSKSHVLSEDMGWFFFNHLANVSHFRLEVTVDRIVRCKSSFMHLRSLPRDSMVDFLNAIWRSALKRLVRFTIEEPSMLKKAQKMGE
ncbi:hypothetical protein B0J11DRAFT_568634 [Dendryphion nanum]|uniref:Uncharacterized protein n=1 Tax=Dendryphion nanum TaxID=256645 RepID=A0A9P9DQ27_9PLEO|nr:hypothetical protein B0J11DRAFT_568634 [Dendryphion nanum]